MEKNTKVAIIGAGPAGYVAAIRLQQLGVDSIVFEKEKLGGVCLNWGCIPTKTLVKSANLFSLIKNANKYGIELNNPNVNYNKIFSRQQKVKNQLIKGIEYIFKKRKIEVINEKVSLITNIEGNYIIKGESVSVNAKYVIIATGSQPKSLVNVKIDHKNIISSKDILKMRKLPQKITIIGGGVIGCEFASILSQLGVKVEIIEFLPNLLGQEDKEISNRLKTALKKKKIKIHLNTSVENYEEIETGLKLYCSNGINIESEKVLLSVGREPDCKINFENCKIVRKNSSIKINRKFETNLQNVFAIGDVTGKMLLAHVASQQGIEVAKIISGRIKGKNEKGVTINYKNIPRCTFTNPEVASVGLTEEEAQEKYKNIKTGQFPFRANGKALGMGDTFGFVKIIADDTGKLLGMHIIGPMATELIAECTILINNNSKAEQVEDIVFAHPTLSEVISESIEDIHNKAIHKL